MSTQIPAASSHVAWLRDQVGAWRSEGLVTDEQASRILGRYRAAHGPSVVGLSLTGLVLTLGAVFVGVGVIWLVAANLDELAPMARFTTVAAISVALTVGAELLARRREHGGAIPSPVVGAARLLAALVFGGVVFQAAQSLQVPAYEPKLVGLWALGALTYAYAVRGTAPLVVGVAALVVWFVWQVMWDEPSGLGAVLALLVAGTVAISAAGLHRWREPVGLAIPWREAGAGLLLAALFAAAVPYLDRSGFAWSTTLVVGLGAAGLLAVAAVAFGEGWSRVEPLAALALGGAAVILVLWEAGADSDQVGLADWAHAGLAVTAYVVAAAGVAALGTLHDSWRLTALATLALVVFTTFQSFAVFARIVQGAWLFVILGLIFLGTGYLADRGRRQLARSLEGAES